MWGPAVCGGLTRTAIDARGRGSQYTSIDYAQTLTDHGVLASVGSVGDAFDKALVS
jgi:transposase InsO family protein